jgi:putative phosphoribosyl transferase
VVVDDGVATGATARAACLVVRARGAGRVVLAAPAAPVGLAERVPEADDVVTLVSPRPFGAVSQHYADFSPTPEALVLAELASHVRVGPAVP